MNCTLIKNRHLADEVVSLPQPVEIAQGVERQKTIGRIFGNDHDCTPITLESPACGLSTGGQERGYLRLSQIDDCAYCLDMHTRDLLRKGQNIEKIALVQARAEVVNLFDAREHAVLAWAETVTLVAETSVPDEAYAAAHIAFEEREVLDLTIAIGVMNIYCRMAISFQNTPQAALSASSIERDKSPATGDRFRYGRK
jgi:AhpD family alkylhydroperoxidase